MSNKVIPLGVTGEAVRANILRLRKAQRLTTISLSSRLAELGRPIAANGITKIEKGTRRVDVDDLAALASVLGVRPEQLLMPFECERCHGNPPAGFVCATCGAESSNA